MTDARKEILKKMVEECIYRYKTSPCNFAEYKKGFSEKALSDLDKLDLSVEELKKVILSQGSYGQWNSDELRTVYVEKLAQALIDARERKRK